MHFDSPFVQIISHHPLNYPTIDRSRSKALVLFSRRFLCARTATQNCATLFELCEVPPAPVILHMRTNSCHLLKNLCVWMNFRCCGCWHTHFSKKPCHTNQMETYTCTLVQSTRFRNTTRVERVSSISQVTKYLWAMHSSRPHRKCLPSLPMWTCVRHSAFCSILCSPRIFEPVIWWVCYFWDCLRFWRKASS